MRLVLCRRLFLSRRGSARDRLRSNFLIRFAAGDAMAIFGLFPGIFRAPQDPSAPLFLSAILALLHAAPTRKAYVDASALAAGAEG